jgi:hypothetical protein
MVPRFAVLYYPGIQVFVTRTPFGTLLVESKKGYLNQLSVVCGLFSSFLSQVARSPARWQCCQVPRFRVWKNPGIQVLVIRTRADTLLGGGKEREEEWVSVSTRNSPSGVRNYCAAAAGLVQLSERQSRALHPEINRSLIVVAVREEEEELATGPLRAGGWGGGKRECVKPCVRQPSSSSTLLVASRFRLPLLLLGPPPHYVCQPIATQNLEQLRFLA